MEAKAVGLIWWLFVLIALMVCELVDLCLFFKSALLWYLVFKRAEISPPRIVYIYASNFVLLV